jgi:hypothetical protein
MIGVTCSLAPGLGLEPRTYRVTPPQPPDLLNWGTPWSALTTSVHRARWRHRRTGPASNHFAHHVERDDMVPTR